MLVRACSGVNTPVLNAGDVSFEREAALVRCAAWASLKFSVLATAKSSNREVAASNLMLGAG